MTLSASLSSWLFPSRLRGRLVMLVLLGVFPALVLIIHNALEIRRMGLETASEEALRMVRLAAVEHDRLLENGRQLLVTLAHLREVRVLDGPACEELLSELLKAYPVYANLGVVRPDGELVATARPVTNFVNLAELKVFQDVTNLLDLVIGEYQIDPLTQRATVFMAYPVLGPGRRLRAVTLLALDLDWLYHLHATAHLPEGSSFTVTDRNRVTLARFPDPERKYVGQVSLPVRPPTPHEAEAQWDASVRRDYTRERTSIGIGRDGVTRLYGIKDLGTQMGDNAVRVVIGIPVAQAHAVAERLLWRNLGLLGLATVLAVLAAWIGGGVFVVSKVNKLVEATRRMQGGDMGVRMGDIADRSEVGELAAAFDLMAEGLQRQFVERERAQEALRTLNKELEQRVNDRTRELKRSNEDLEQFAYAASHDLQEPLRMVTSYLGLLEQRYQEKLDQDARDFIGYAVDGARRMHRLINDLLTYSRVQTRAKVFEPVDCRRIVEQVLENLKVSISESKGEVVVADSLPRVQADPSQLTHLFQNLIGNALKFRGERPLRVELGAKRDDGDWQFWVRDNGIGIAPKQFERIFVIFQRLHSPDKYPGTGIGLALCKKIVERHGGRIWVESQPGQGSTFYFTLPVAPVSSAP